MVYLGLYAQMFVQNQSLAGINHIYEQRQFTGGGCAFADINNDGYDDLYITGGASPDKLYLNNQDGTFEDISFLSRIIISGNYYTSGVNAGDFDNDGFIDFFIATTTSEFGGLAKNLLFHNKGDNTFREIWPIDSPEDNVRSVGSVLFDYDLDGDLDIYVYNYVDQIRLIKNDDGNTIDFDHDCYSNRMYENIGDLVFRETTSTLGLEDGGCGLAAIATDIDQDGDLDIYLGNDFGLQVEPNKLFRNDFSESGKFVEISQSIGLRKDIYCMGIAIGDIDGDADQDIYMTNNGRNVLVNNEQGLYTDQTEQAGVGNTWIKEDSTLAVSWGTFLADVDNDMDLDLYVANGYTPSTEILPTEFFDSDHLYLNNGTGIFKEEDQISALGNPYVSRGTAYSDYDKDGDIDFITVVYDRPSNGGGGKCILYTNKGNENNWLGLDLEGLVCNRDAFGAKVKLFVGGNIRIHEVEGGSSHTSKNSSNVHFGVGSNEFIDSILIYWPGSPDPQAEYNIPINTYSKIIQDSIYLEVVTSIDNSINNDIELIISPNPTNDILHIMCPEITISSVQLFSTSGKLVLRKQEMDSNFIDLTKLSTGLYYVNLQTNRGIITRSVVKQ